MRAKQALGQNFLMHQATADRIADAAGLTPADTVLEIGPGTGMLTRALLPRAGKVIAIEADHELIAGLKETFASETAAKKLDILSGDFREFDLSAMAPGYKVVANIPYYITGEIVRKLLSTPNKPASVTLLVQKEVAERIARSPKESLLSLSVKVYGIPIYRFTVPRGAFRPAPKVDSAVLHIGDIASPFENQREEEGFFAVLRAGFAHKRKRLAKNLEAVASAETIRQAFASIGISPDARAEDVPLSAWKQLAGIA